MEEKKFHRGFSQGEWSEKPSPSAGDSNNKSIKAFILEMAEGEFLNI